MTKSFSSMLGLQSKLWATRGLFFLMMSGHFEIASPKIPRSFMYFSNLKAKFDAQILKICKIHWNLTIDKKFRIVFQISQLSNIPQKWFSTQSVPMNVRFQMRQTPTMYASYFWRNYAITGLQEEHLKQLCHDFCLIFT